MLKVIDKKVKKMKWYDISLTKLSVASFVLFIISFLSGDIIEKIKDLRWLWLFLFILTAIIPSYKMLKK